MRRECGSCAYFIKFKNLPYTHMSGLCDALDYGAKTDAWRGCAHWKAIPYKYKKKYQYHIRRKFKQIMEAEEKEYQVQINERLIYSDDDGWHIGLCPIHEPTANLNPTENTQ